jgi:hypothetical protein
MTSHSHSDLEVAPSADLEVVPSTDQDTHKYLQYSESAADTDKIAYHSITPGHDQPTSQTVCGLRKKTFWIVVIIAVLVVVSAVGGGVSGALATRKSGEPNRSQIPVTDMQSSTAPSSASSTQAVSTTTIFGPSYSPLSTLLRDCPSSNDTVHSITYGDKSYQFRKLCNGAYQNTDNTEYYVQAVVDSLDKCIDSCANYNQENRTEIQASRNRIYNSVCWRNTFGPENTSEGGCCFGFVTRNITINGQTVFSLAENGETICDSAVLINQDF